MRVFRVQAISWNSHDTSKSARVKVLVDTV